MWPWNHRVRWRTSRLSCSTPCWETHASGEDVVRHPCASRETVRSRSSVREVDHGSPRSPMSADRRVNWPLPPRLTELVRMRAICATADTPQNSKSCSRVSRLVRLRIRTGSWRPPTRGSANRRATSGIAPGESRPSASITATSTVVGSSCRARHLREEPPVADVERGALALAGVRQAAATDDHPIAARRSGDRRGAVLAAVVDHHGERARVARGPPGRSRRSRPLRRGTR